AVAGDPAVGRVLERRVGDGELVAALLGEADRALGERLEVAQRRLVPRLEGAARAPLAVEQHRDGEPLDRARRLDRAAHGLAELVVDRLAGARAAPARSVGRAAHRRLARAGYVRRDAGHALGEPDAVLVGLHAALLAALDLRLRVVALLGLLGLGPVEIGAHLRDHAARPDDRRQDRLHAPAELALEPRLVLAGACGLRGVDAVVAGRRQHAPAAVDHGHAIGREVLDRRRHQVHDAAHLRRGQLAARPQLDDHRRARLALAIADERRALGQRDLHARARHRLELRDRARQLALERAPVVHAVHE